jgi:hypothetical protein
MSDQCDITAELSSTNSFGDSYFEILISPLDLFDTLTHGLRTPNEGTNQRNLKFWADVADKICFGRT